MTQMSVAIMTFGISRVSGQTPSLRAFEPYIKRVVRLAKQAPGFQPQQPELGAFVQPRFFQAAHREQGLLAVQTLFLWDDLEAVAAFAYTGLHQHVLSLNRREGWFHSDEWPSYVLWWAEPSSSTWADGCVRLEQLQDVGPSATAFGFRSTFNHEAEPYKLDKGRMQQYRQWYSKRGVVDVGIGQPGARWTESTATVR